MKKTPFASKHNHNCCVSNLQLPYHPRKSGISRVCSVVLILALLSQVLFIGPIRSAKAKGPVPAPPPVSAPPEPFHFENSSSAVAESSFWRASLLTSLADILTKRDARNDTSAGSPRGVKIPPSSDKSSVLAAAEPKVALKQANITAPPMPTPAGSVAFNFDTDGKADVSRWHPATHEFKIKNSGSTNSYTVVTSLGSSSSKPVPGDYDGNGKTDLAVYNPGTSTNPGTWSYIQSPITTSSTPQPLGTPIGIAGDIPAVGDYDGDGKSDQAVYRPSNGRWYINQSTAGYSEYQESTTGGIPIPGNYDTDSKTDLAVFQTTSTACYWNIHRSQAGYISKQWGSPGDIPVQGDFNGNGISDLTVYHPVDGTWYVAELSGTNLEEVNQVGWGNYGDQPAPADYDGDNVTDYAVWRPTTGVWYIIGSVPPSGSEACEGCVQYLYRTLGDAGDTALPSAYTKQIGGSVTGYDMAAARLAPGNATGGTNLYSQNFSWGSSLVSLPGRAGLNAGFGISYNSLVWLKSASTGNVPNISFDPDRSNISPGFRFGFPDIEPVYYDSDKKLWAYMMVTPDGGRKEFRQIGASSTYETADSGYTQLVTTGASSPNSPVENITIKVTTTDGTQMSYAWAAGAFRCNKIQDRNGNYISISNDEQGILRSVTDTLGRVINVNYDTELYPTSITQTWKNNNGASGNTTHTWASFSYTTQQVATNFDTENLTVVGPPNGTNLKVLEKVTYADGSYTKFLYNSYVQVKQIENWAADNHKLNYVRTNLDTFSGTSSAQSDCPRFTHTYNWAENFNMSTGGSPTAQETDTENTAPADSTFSGPGGTESTKVVNVKMAGLSDNHYSRLHFAVATESQPWKTGLPVATEDCTDTNSNCSSRQRWTWTNWEQDQVGLTPSEYLVNPRVIETQVGDGANTKRTTVSYIQASSTECTGSGSSIGGTEEAEEGTNVSCFGLASEVDVYDATLSYIIKKSVTGYDLSSNYVSRRIIGLPSITEAWGWNDISSDLEYVSKLTYGYDEDGYSGSGQSVSPTHHCNSVDSECPVSYGSGFTYRGNLTSTTRWDVENSTSSITSSIKYNTVGMPILQTDPRGRVSVISYADNYNSSGNPTTYAYPTTVTDAGGFSSTIKYRYDIGANVWARSPTPYGTGNTYGKTTSRTYDQKGRVEKETIENTGAYTKYVYDNNGAILTTKSTLIHEGTGAPGTSDEVETVTLFDGTGRVLATRSPHTFSGSSVATWSATVTQYDILGRVSATSIPTEVSVGTDSWTPAGDDETRGFKYNKRGYDWKDRLTITIPSDSTTHIDGTNSDGKETLFTYDGCGCAGRQVTTIRGPESNAIDVGGTVPVSGKRKVQKIREDILGRTVATELWSLDGGSLYSTTTNKYNGRDQVTNTIQYEGAENPSNMHQTTITSYDGHGRVYQVHKPEFFDGTASNPTYITNTYNSDDTLATMTDPRGVVTSYTYGNPSASEKRPLLTNIAYATPSANPTPNNPLHVPSVQPVTFEYDAAGNRKTMADGTGSLSYEYDELSRLKKETKDFLDDLPNAPSGGVYPLTYTYHLCGGLKSITDPFNRITTYSADKVGRITAIGAGGSLTTNETAYMSGISYRAFGAVKSMTMSTTNPTAISMSYDNALRPTAYDATNSVSGATHVQQASYTYQKDSMVNEIDNQKDANFDQTNEYDFAGRLLKNKVGPSGNSFNQAMTYDAFNNLTSRHNQTYDTYQDYFSATYENNRKASGGSNDTYDAGGNVVYSYAFASTQSGGRPYADIKTWNFDAAGRMVHWDEDGPWGNTTTNGGETLFDGDGRQVKVTELQKVYGDTDWSRRPLYHLYSTVTGQKITDVVVGGGDGNSRVYLGSTLIYDTTIQHGDIAAQGFIVTDPVSGSTQELLANGQIPDPTSSPNSRVENAGLGTSVPTNTSAFPEPLYNRGGHAGNAESGCMLDIGFAAGPDECRFWLKDYLIAGGHYAFPMLVPGQINGDPTWVFGGWASFDFTNDDPPEITVKKTIDGVDKRLKGDCWKKIHELIKSGAEKLLGKEEYEKKQEIQPGVTSMKDYVDSFTKDTLTGILKTVTATENLTVKATDFNIDAGPTEKENSWVQSEADISSSQSKLTVYGGFFRNIVQGDKLKAPDANNLKYSYSFGDATTSEFRELTLIHEAIHASLTGLSDAILGSIIAGRPLGKSEGSQELNKYLRKHCK